MMIKLKVTKENYLKKTKETKFFKTIKFSSKLLIIRQTLTTKQKNIKII